MSSDPDKKNLSFMVYDARPEYMAEFVETLKLLGGAALPEPVAVVPPDALYGHCIVPAPSPVYQRLMIFGETEDMRPVQELVRDLHGALIDAVIMTAKSRAAEVVPPLMTQRGYQPGGEPLVLMGDPDRGGMATLRYVLRETYDEDLMPDNAISGVTILRLRDTVFFTASVEYSSLDPWVIMIVYTANKASRDRVQKAFDRGEAEGPQPPLRRTFVQQQIKADALGVPIEAVDFDLKFLTDGQHRIIAAPKTWN